MNKEIYEELFNEKYHEYINDYINKNINSEMIRNNPILEIEYDIDASKKDIYSLASERDIKKVQIQSDQNELDYKLSQGKITNKEYQEDIEQINLKMHNLDLLYDDLIFEIIDNTNIEEIQNSILSYNLNKIDLDRLARAIVSVSENKINDFRNNNKQFMMEKLSYWNYKYNKISKAISKAREVESFIMSLIEN
ncbi:MAG: hypothetical protein J6O62_01295 [Bacilli bacterium]|nr:hypothetical protein [Bacilli bacterium]